MAAPSKAHSPLFVLLVPLLLLLEAVATRVAIPRRMPAEAEEAAEEEVITDGEEVDEKTTLLDKLPDRPTKDERLRNAISRSYVLRAGDRGVGGGLGMVRMGSSRMIDRSYNINHP
jgi:hypothetical protein